jgi:hypothetical protein
MFDPDSVVFRAASLALGDVKKNPLATQRQIFNNDPANAMDGGMVNGPACRAYWSGWLYKVDVKMKTGIGMFKHFDNLKVWQIKQFRDSLELHRVSPLCHGSVGNKTLTKLVKSGAFSFSYNY